MVDENPAFLPVGTEVSAKFKGAYCEARVKKVQRDLKVKVNFKEHPFGSSVLPCSEFDSSTKFEVSEMTKAMKDGKLCKCQIASVKDASTYHVVFNDGDEKTLRRSQMVLKGKKHFPTDGNLDMMPLTNPESFSSPVVRVAAKRGAQKMKSMTGDSESRKRTAEDDEDEPATKKSTPRQRGRGQRRPTAASSSTANDAKSDGESSDESSEEKERRKRRDEEKAGSSTSSRISSDDEISVPSTSNGAISAARAEKQRLREIKQQEKEMAKKKKEEERERKRSEKEEAKREKDLRRAASRHNRDMKRLYRSAIVKAAERDSKFFKRTLVHPSIRYVWRPLSLGKKRRRKKALKRRGLATLRNCRLSNDWNSVCRLLKMSSGPQRFRCWSQVTTDNVSELTEAYDFLSSEENLKLTSKWLRGLENVRKWKFVLLYENPNKVRRLLPNLNIPECTFSERMEIPKGDIDLRRMGRSLQRDEWYVGILLPQPYPPPSSTNGVQRLVRHLATGELVRVWEDDLLPFNWIPNFVKDDVKYLAKQRPADRKNAFQVAWKFVTGWEKSRMCKQFMVSRCGLRSHPQKRITADSGIPTTAPPPPQIYDDDEEESEESEASDSDSDSSIINAPDEEKARYVASYMSYFDNKNVTVPSLSIQSCDIDIFYFYQLVKRFGGLRKVSAPGAHWTSFAKKLIPSAVGAEEELRAWFKKNLEPYITIQNKLEIPLDSLLPRGDRKQVRPGQYSEARKRKSVTLQDVDHSATPSAPTYSNSRRGGRGGGRGRKRKSTPDDRRRGKRERRSGSSRRGSRATTASPDPNEQAHEEGTQSDDDDTASSLFSADGSERKGSAYRKPRQKKTPTRTTGSRNSRSASARHDEHTPVVPAKKGRPRKHAASSASKQTAKHAKPRECDLSGFVFANILSQIHTTQDLHACYTDGGWWAATAIADMDDYTNELMEVMLDHQATNPSYVTTMSSDTESRLKEINDQLRVATHYKGWNQRYDEDMKLDKLMVKAVDQLESRRRFRRLPRGSELLPETMALVEEKMTTQHQITDGSKTRPRVSREEFVRLAREALSSTKSKNESEKQEVAQRRLHDSDDEQPEPKEEEESDSDDNNDDQPGPSSRGEKKKEEVSSDDDDDHGDDDEGDDDDTVVMAPGSKEESQKRKSSEQNYAERGFESESDEPEYPPGPSSPELLAMRPPILHNVTSLDRISSSGSSNYPVLSRQASNTSVNSSMQSIFSPSNSLSHSGPLTLAEVPPSESSSLAKHQQRHDNNEEVRGERVEPAGDDAEPVHKKSRKNEAEGLRGLTSPIRLPTAPQFQSGALTLDIPQPVESSGPIEPTSSAKRGTKKKTGTPVFQKPSPSITSTGPLTLSPSKTRPPGSSPLGRPKKKSQTEVAAPASTSTESDNEEEEPSDTSPNVDVVHPSEAVTAGSVSGKESQEGTSGSTTPATIDDKEDDSTDKEQDKTPQSQSTPRGLGSSARGKRKRGGRFGGSYSTKPTKTVKRKERDEHEEDKDDDNSSFVTPTPTHSTRPDSFQVQKNRMAKLMEQEGTSESYHLLDTLSDFDMTFASMHPEDIIMCLEERTTELREAHGQCKQELSQLEKRFRLQNDAKRKAAEARTPSSSSSTAAPKN